MITPDEIRNKASRLYTPATAAWLAGDESFFPRRIPVNLRFPKHLPQSEVIRLVAELRENSKTHLGYGYTLHFEQINNRTHGDNSYPTAIAIDTLEDLLKLTRKQREFRTLETAVQKLRSHLPQLEDWLAQHAKRLLPVAEQLDDLILVVEYLRDNPRPDIYLRELPLRVSTKLVEQNKLLLRDWLDKVLAAQHIDFGCGQRHFETRYGFRYPRKHILVRLLDPSLRAQFGFPCDELSLPADELAKLPVADLRLTIVENKINLLTLPHSPRSMALGGFGNNLTEFEKIRRLSKQSLLYWGDLDIEGFCILARFRHQFPQTQSFLMDITTLHEHRSLWTQRPTAAAIQEPAELQPHEADAFRYCRDHGVRLEQEHIPQAYVERLYGQAAAAGLNV